MLCRNPYTNFAGHFYPCGQCNPCRFNRRREWAHRLILEASKHENSCFLTLTYDQEHLPKDSSLDPKHPQDWLKRFRKAISPLKIRYYLVGEYGDQTQRPHYHAALYGVSVDFTQIVKETWGMGHVMLGDLTFASAGYIAGYVTKKMTAKNDPRLKGRYPEFARMSLRPGIGADAMDDVAETLSTDAGIQLMNDKRDVPSSLNHGGRSMPLGKYLRKKLREKVGMPETFRRSTHQQEMRAMLEVARSNPKNTSLKPSELLVRLGDQKVASQEARFKIFNKGGTL